VNRQLKQNDVAYFVSEERGVKPAYPQHLVTCYG